ncbi:unnamed protein product [Brachionus calyciflorus]|uniref:Uncharacterized protein n=1 Tax=Brachionus calyciflorus TaxID=104777 RepID=A0A814EAH9_9BILA|nr:unnamed protein product [Brachionus calyciflorus]
MKFEMNHGNCCPRNQSFKETKCQPKILPKPIIPIIKNNSILFRIIPCLLLITPVLVILYKEQGIKPMPIKAVPTPYKNYALFSFLINISLAYIITVNMITGLVVFIFRNEEIEQRGAAILNLLALMGGSMIVVVENYFNNRTFWPNLDTLASPGGRVVKALDLRSNSRM